MAFNIVFSDPFGFEGSQSTGSNALLVANLGGIGSFVAVPFLATSNQTINKVSFYTNAVANITGLQVMVGIGTWNDKIPAYNAGLGNSLIFSSMAIKTSNFTDQTVNFETIPDITLVAGTKYFLGVQTVARGASSNYNLAILPMNNTFDDTGNYRIYRQTSAGFTRQYSANYSCFNWGYYSGSGNTTWYNPNFGGSGMTAGDQTRYTLFSSTGQSQFGFSFYMSAPFNAVEMEEIGFAVRTTKYSSSDTPGFGITYNVVLYDSDGTTALTGSTQTYVPSNANNFRKVFMPLKYTLQANKLYYFAFNQESTNSSTDYVIACGYNNQFMAGSSITTYNFRKNTPSSTPVYNYNDLLLYDVVVSKIYGNKQGSVGNDFRIYNPATGNYV